MGLPPEAMSAGDGRRRSQVYNALFEIQAQKPRRLSEDRPLALSELAEEIRALKEPVFLVGDGAELTAAYFQENNIPYRLAPENLRWQSAWGVAMGRGRQACRRSGRTATRLSAPVSGGAGAAGAP